MLACCVLIVVVEQESCVWVFFAIGYSCGSSCVSAWGFCDWVPEALCNPAQMRTQDGPALGAPRMGSQDSIPQLHFLYSSLSCLCHIYSWFLPMSWVLGLSILLSICRVYIYVYMFGWLCRATCSFVSSSSMLGISYAVQNEKDLWNLHRVIGKVLVLDLLVVYKIPCSSCMWTRQDVIGVFPSYYCLSGTNNLCAYHSPVPGTWYVTTSLLLLST